MTRPRIGLDGYNLAMERGTGIATYARNLSVRLGAMGAEVGVLYGTRASAAPDPVLREVTLFDTRIERPPGLGRMWEDVKGILRLRLGVTAAHVPLSGVVDLGPIAARQPRQDLAWNVFELYRSATLAFGWFPRRFPVRLPHAVDAMHWTYPLPLCVPGVPNLFTIHDLIPLRLPYTTLDNKRRHWRLLKALAEGADHIVTVSEASRRDILRILGVPEDRVTNTWQSVELPRRLLDKPEAVARAEVEGAFGLEWGGYFLFFGAIEPKKNLSRLIEAYLAAGSRHPLVVCGRQAWRAERELALLYEDHAKQGDFDSWRLPVPEVTRKLRERVILQDYAPFNLLVSLIRGARAVLFPSIAEGFGLPVLEAMLLGAPVMTGAVASLPEVAGEAALLVDPLDPAAMTAAIRALDADAGLRAELARRGPEQAARFGPAPYEARLRALYARLGVAFPAAPAAAPA